MAADSVLWFLIVIAVFGLIVGAVGRLLVPGPTRLGVLGTMGAGVAGALIGGFVGRLFLGPNLTHGWIWVLSILGATLVVWLVSRRGVGYGGRSSRRGLMWERPYDDRVVVDGGNREYRSGRSRWSRGGLLPRPAYGHRADVDDGYGYGTRRRRRFF